MTRTTITAAALAAGLVGLGCEEPFAPRGATLQLDLPDSVVIGVPSVIRAVVREESGDLVTDGTNVYFVASVIAGLVDADGGSSCDSPRPAGVLRVETTNGLAEALLCVAEPGLVRVSAESGQARGVDSITVAAPGPPPVQDSY